MSRIPRPHVRRLGGLWWIIGTTVACRDGTDDYMPVGSYGTRAEAEDDLRGLRRFWAILKEEKEEWD